MTVNCDAVVIGSGFGGSVAACRLAQAGCSVTVMERGRRYDQNPFPRNWKNPTDGWLWQVGQGLFDLRHFSRMMVVQGAGLGGGSLIYANVHLRAPHEVFNQGWPAAYNRPMLDPYYDLVAYMLDINPITASKYLGMPPKSTLMKRMAEAMGRSAQFCLPNIAVDFGRPEKSHVNKFGALQQGCRFCGECDIGCNFHAKNTLDFNYLKLAQDKAARIETQCEVVRIEPAADGGYSVHFLDHRKQGQPGRLDTKYIFVCAGAVNSTELLLRCRDQFGSLPNLNRCLGNNYSGNGDFLAFAFNTSEQFMPSEGPTITSGIVYARRDGDADNWFILEEGGYPKEIGSLVQVLNPKNGLLADAKLLSRLDLDELLRRNSAEASPRQAADHSSVFLAMGRDRANGHLLLHPLTFALDVRWDLQSNIALYEAEEAFVKILAEKMGGNAADNPFWSLLRIPVTVHNLGGCPLADSPDRGVLNPDGEVFGYPGLFVLDGAAIPVAVGANPSHTIAAVAERNIETAIRRIIGDKTWQAPERRLAGPIDDPLSDIVIPSEGVPALTV
ncbi:MAG: GMC family oxidoreductase [Deltaproteobacteria bacterium]|nr:GMC family oxidoreductase [Deltaproteobacteria bacterium]